jgi:hypothetical protein
MQFRRLFQEVRDHSVCSATLNKKSTYRLLPSNLTEYLPVTFKNVINCHGQIVALQQQKESGYVHLGDRTFQSQ